MKTLSRSITTQGTTASPSSISCVVRESNGAQSTDVAFLRVRVCDEGAFADATNATIAVANGCTVVETHSSGKDVTIKSSVGAHATKTLTISGVVSDTETVTIGTRVYEFDSHASSTITAGRVRVNIAASATKAQGTLTMDTQPTAGDTVTIGTRSYLWVASGAGDAAGEISVGANLAAAKVNFVAAINGTDGFNTAHPTVSAAAFSSNDCVITALAGGVGGNSIATTETFTAGSNVFDAATLGTTTAGASCTAANAVTALVAAITGDSSAVVSAVDGAGDTVVVTALTAGIAGNSIALGETLANGSWAGGATLMTGGTADNPGIIDFTLTNATAETVTLRFGASPVSPIPDIDLSVTTNVTHAA